MNNVSLVGRLTADPELKTTTTGVAYTRFSVAVDRIMSKEKKEEREAENKSTADFPRVSVYGNQAEAICKYIQKGALISISGTVRTDNFDGADGEKVYYTEINANRVRFLEPKKPAKLSGLGDGVEIEVHDDIPF